MLPDSLANTPADLLPARLFLNNGAVFSGFSPSNQLPVAFGEVVFTTGMVGYPESLTDPSYSGQILVFTYPLIGNYGVAGRETWESSGIHVRGVVMSSLALQYSSHSASQSLYQWLTDAQVPFLVGADTRAITLHIRDAGVIPGAISTDIQPPQAFEDFSSTHFVSNVSIKEPIYYGEGEKTIIVIDCGIKENILRQFARFPVRIKRVPWDYDFTQEEFDGVFVSNGPGDPKHCQATIDILKKTMSQQKPIFGICLGTQLLALSVGADTYKLRFGHRAQNQPCQDVRTGRCYLTSQNHSYAVNEQTLPADWQVIFRNLNDQSIEGISHQTQPWFAVQFHPESAPGPRDTEWLFQTFYDAVCRQ